MPADALTPPQPAQAKTVFSHLERDRLELRPWVAFTFTQTDPVYESDGVTPTLNSVGQPLFRSRRQTTTLRTDDPAKLSDLEGRAHAYHQAGKLPDDTDTTLAYEELAAANAAGSLAAIQALGYEIRGNFIPWN